MAVDNHQQIICSESLTRAIQFILGKTMFKNATVFKTNDLLFADSNTIALQLEINGFISCGPSQEKSVGWVPPRGDAHGQMVEVIAGQYVMKLMIETKTVPGALIKEKVDAECRQIEDKTGRKPGKKERRELADDMRITLLPNAFAKRVAVIVWINPSKNHLWVTTTSQSRIDTTLTELVRAIDGLQITHVNTQISPSTVMMQLLVNQDNDEFAVGRACELKACDESKAVVRYKNHNLDTPDVVKHIQEGKVAKSMQLTWNDRVAFTLTDTGALKSLVFLDVVFEQDFESGFDADVTIATSELTALQSDLLVLMGGEVTQ